MSLASSISNILCICACICMQVSHNTYSDQGHWQFIFLGVGGRRGTDFCSKLSILYLLMLLLIFWKVGIKPHQVPSCLIPCRCIHRHKNITLYGGVQKCQAPWDHRKPDLLWACFHRMIYSGQRDKLRWWGISSCKWCSNWSSDWAEARAAQSWVDSYCFSVAFTQQD